MSALQQTLERVRVAAGGRRGEPRPGGPPARFETEMRALRGQLQPLLDQRKPAMLAVTACNHGEGATTVARELARSLAVDGVKVLLAGRAAQLFRRAERDAVTLKAADRRITPTASPALSFVDTSDLHRPNGPNGGVNAFRDWLQAHKAGFEVVLLDMPPLLDQPNWAPLLPAQDGVMLVMEAERTRAIVLDTTVSAIEGAGGHILGVVFNRRRLYIPRAIYRWL